jgi:hypothetical protein
MSGPASELPRIFLSYRRDDSEGYVGRLFDGLAARFGAEQVFRDVVGLRDGVDFKEDIRRAVGSCSVLLAVIGPRWLTSTDTE